MEDALAYAVVEDLPVSWQDYQSGLADPDGEIPTGLILHVAGPTDEGVRTIAVWESEEAWQRSRAPRPGERRAVERFAPATLRELRVAHLLKTRS